MNVLCVYVCMYECTHEVESEVTVSTCYVRTYCMYMQHTRGATIKIVIDNKFEWS